MIWRIVVNSEEVRKFIVEMPSKPRAKLMYINDLLEEFGPAVGMPHVRALGHGLYEIRLLVKEANVRVFFCVDNNRFIYLLHSFYKKTQKTPHRELEKARHAQKLLQ